MERGTYKGVLDSSFSFSFPVARDEELLLLDPESIGILVDAVLGAFEDDPPKKRVGVGDLLMDSACCSSNLF